MNELLTIGGHTIEYGNFIGQISSNFGINYGEYDYTRNIKYFVERIDLLNDKENIVSFHELLYIVDEFTNNHNKDMVEIYVSDGFVNSWEVTDTFGKKMFENQKPLHGWLVFVDPCKIANWSHPCEYWLIVNKSIYINNFYGIWKPNKNLKIKKINK